MAEPVEPDPAGHPAPRR